MGKVIRQNITTFILSFLILFFIVSYLVVRIGIIRPLNAALASGDVVIQELQSKQEGQSELLDQIKSYRNGLYILNLILEGRKNVLNGSDEKNPFLIFNYTQVLDDIRRLLPRDARVAKFQVNNKGLITAPIESVDYASLGRVIKSLKDSELFTEVKIPSGVQRTPLQTTNAYGQIQFDYVYSFVLQAKLDPVFWQDTMPFTDVNPHAYYAQAVRDLFISGSIEGYAKRLFKPDQAINRAEFFKIALFEFLSKDVISINDYRKYIDLSDEDWYFQYAQLASKMGIAEGDEVGRFHPDQTVTRIEALKSILSIFEIEILDPELEKIDEEGNRRPLVMPFRDITSSHKDYPVVLTALRSGLLDNIQMNFNPQTPAARSDVAYWVWKLKFDYLNK